MAAPVWQSSTTLAGGSGTTAVIAIPGAPLTANDVILVTVYKENTAAVTPHSGYTEKGTAPTTTAPQAQHTFWYRAAGGETGNLTFSWTGSVFRAATAHRFTGCVTTGDPIQDIVTAFSNASVSTLAVSLPAGTGDTLLYLAQTDWQGGNSWTSPGGFTERSDIDLIGDTTKSNPGAAASGSVSQTANISGPLTSVLLSLASGSAATGDMNPVWFPGFMAGSGFPGFMLSAASPLNPIALPWAGQDVTGAPLTVNQDDLVGLSDGTVFDQSKEFTDPTGLTDNTAFTVAPVITDSAGLTDAALVELSKLVAQTDSTGLTDAAVLDQSKTVTDSAGLTDSATFTQSKAVTDSAGLTDSSLVESGKAVAQTDSAGLTDGQAFSQSRVLSDPAGLTDAAGLTTSKVLTDSTGLTDAASVGLLRDLVVTDNAGLTDAPALFRTVVLTDLVGLADAAAISQFRGFTDSVGLTDPATVTTVIPIPPITFRPNAGTTDRPSSGTTPRPNSGVTARLSNGLTVRPDSGITARP